MWSSMARPAAPVTIAGMPFDRSMDGDQRHLNFALPCLSHSATRGAHLVAAVPPFVADATLRPCRSVACSVARSLCRCSRCSSSRSAPSRRGALSKPFVRRRTARAPLRRRLRGRPWARATCGAGSTPPCRPSRRAARPPGERRCPQGGAPPARPFVTSTAVWRRSPGAVCTPSSRRPADNPATFDVEFDGRPGGAGPPQRIVAERLLVVGGPAGGSSPPATSRPPASATSTSWPSACPRAIDARRRRGGLRRELAAARRGARRRHAARPRRRRAVLGVTGDRPIVILLYSTRPPRSATIWAKTRPRERSASSPGCPHDLEQAAGGRPTSACWPRRSRPPTRGPSTCSPTR